MQGERRATSATAGAAPAGPSLCRACFHVSAADAERCVRCGHPRLVRHPELLELAITHIDCDAFYAAIEKRDRPELADRPVIVGGRHRGVVATACYVARTHGVHSAMPMFQALKACPDAVVIPPDMAKYAAVGRQVRARMEALTPQVEPLSIDEAFLDLSGTVRLHGRAPAVTLARFAAEMERDLGITVSVGLSHNKFLAKLASDLQKPRGFSIIGRAETPTFLAGLPVSRIWGIGKAMQARLQHDGITRIADLRRFDEKHLAGRYGSIGLRLFRLARGEDSRAVTPGGKAKSVSAETTFEENLSTAADLLPVLRRLCERVSARLKDQAVAGRTVVLKLKTADFRVLTRNRRLAEPSRLANRIFQSGRALLEREIDGTSFRLLGIGVTGLTEAWRADPDDLLDPDAARRARAEAAMDTIRSRYGEAGVGTGLTFAPRPRRG